MTRAPRVALIHALSASVAPVNDEMARVWPACERMNLLDDSLSSELARSATGLDAAMTERFVALADYALRAGAQGILFTCSAFGPCIDAVARRYPGVPVLKPNEPMIVEATELGGRIGLVASFAPTLESMPSEFPPHLDLRLTLAEGALEALRAGDAALHDAVVLSAAERLAAQGCSAIALAQFSMARAAPLVRTRLGLPVLSTVGSAVRAMQARFG